MNLVGRLVLPVSTLQSALLHLHSVLRPPLELPHRLSDVLVVFDRRLHPRNEAVGLAEPVDALC